MKPLKTIQEGGWRKTWSKLIPGQFGGNAYTDLMFYDQTEAVNGRRVDDKVELSISMQKTSVTPERKILSSKEEPRASHICSVQKIRQTVGSTEHLLLDPQSDIIWPGSLILASSVATGEYKAPTISQDRSPIKLSISHKGISGLSYKEIENPELAYAQEALKHFHQVAKSGSFSARTAANIYSIYSKEHLNVALKGHYKSGVEKVTGSFDFSTDSIKNKVVVDFRQIYYTVDVSTQHNHFFESPPLGDDIAYVSSVTYGRMLLFAVESTEDTQTLKAALAYSSGKTASIDLKAKYNKVLKESTINVLILGGDPSAAAKITNITNGIEGIKETIKKYIEEGSTGGLQSPPAPLSYRLRYLSDGAIANVKLSTTYQSRNCQKSTGKFSVLLKKVVLLSWDDPWPADAVPNRTEEIFGSFEARAYAKEGQPPFARKMLWHTNRDQYAPLHSQLDFKDELNSALEINEEVWFTFKDFPNVKETGFIELIGSIKERDEISSDDDYGTNKPKRIPLREAIFESTYKSAEAERLGKNYPGGHPDKFKLQFQSGHARVEIWFEINPVE